jgi:hypothetical protein
MAEPASISGRAEVASEQAAARAWLTRHLRFERRLAELRWAHAHARSSETSHGSPPGPPSRRRAPVWACLGAVVLGACVAAGLTFVAAPSAGSSSHRELTPVAQPRPTAAAGSSCVWRSRGVFCLSPSELHLVTSAVAR